MVDDPKPVTLALSTSRTLRAFAERIGQSPEALADEAIGRFIGDEEALIEKVELALEQVRTGRTVSHEEVVRGLRETIARAAALKRA